MAWSFSGWFACGADLGSCEIGINATGLGNETKVMVVVLPDATVRESKERVWSALATSGIAPPAGYTVISLDPASMFCGVVYEK